MMVLVSYDVCTVDSGGKTRLRKVAKECVNYGQRVQNSVFEIDTDYGTFLKVKDKLIKLIDLKQDSIRFYYLGNNWEHRVEHFGTKETYKSSLGNSLKMQQKNRPYKRIQQVGEKNVHFKIVQGNFPEKRA